MRQMRMELLGVLAVVALAMPALAGANIGGFIKVADAMLAYGAV